MSSYVSVDINLCRALRHKFIIAGSDKTPMKKNLICETCSMATGKQAYAAYGEDTLSWGDWNAKRKTKD